MKKYHHFRTELNRLKSEGKIDIYFRGINAKSAFGIFKEDLIDYKIKSFAEKLFYFGQKSEHFWKNDVQNKIPLNEVNQDIFNYIFKQFNKLKKTKNLQTKSFIEQNKSQFTFFFDNKNRLEFIQNCLSQEELTSIKQTRDYLLIILHRIGKISSYKNKSHFISTTSSKEISEKFAENGIIITFWDPYKLKLEYNSIYKFDNIIYPEQKENSVFSAIFPHYIFSFIYNGNEYYNPYINKCNNAESCIQNGVDIDQTNFIEKLHQETTLEAGVQTTDNHHSYTEIK